MRLTWTILAVLGCLVVCDDRARAGGAMSAAAIVLTKTVSTDGTCGTVDQIEVPAGTDVTYCYTVGNVGGSTFLTHTLVDSQLGVLLGPNQVQPLTPGQELQVLQQAPISVDTVNIATWTAATYWATRTATDVATVTVTESGPAGCSDQVDNDADGMADCTDPECEGQPVCTAQAPALSTAALVFSALLLLGIGGFGLTARRRV